jgi:hypothetical protein
MAGSGGRSEVGADSLLAAAAVEAALNGAIVNVAPLADERGRRLFEIDLTDGRRVVVRLGSPAEREAMAAAAHWSCLLRPAGIPLPVILGQDLVSEFPSLIFGAYRGVALGQMFDRLSLPALGRIAGGLATVQGVLRDQPSAGRFGFAGSPEMAPGLHWADEVSRVLATARRELRRPADERACDALDQLVTHFATRLDQIPSVATLPPNTRIFVTEDGDIASLDSVEGLFWGDPRWAAARSATDLIARGRPTGMAEAWVVLAGGEVDSVFWLYAAVRCVELMGGPRGGSGGGGAIGIVFSELLRRIERGTSGGT